MIIKVKKDSSLYRRVEQEVLESFKLRRTITGTKSRIDEVSFIDFKITLKEIKKILTKNKISIPKRGKNV
jgi:hypothetical protein